MASVLFTLMFLNENNKADNIKSLMKELEIDNNEHNYM